MIQLPAQMPFNKLELALEVPSPFADQTETTSRIIANWERMCNEELRFRRGLTLTCGVMGIVHIIIDLSLLPSFLLLIVVLFKSRPNSTTCLAHLRKVTFDIENSDIFFLH